MGLFTFSISHLIELVSVNQNNVLDFVYCFIQTALTLILKR